MKVANEMASMLKAFHDKGLVHYFHCFCFSFTKALARQHIRSSFRNFTIFIRNIWKEVWKVNVSSHKFSFTYLALGVRGPPWSMKCDIFAYAILLLELIDKRDQYIELVVLMAIWSEDEILNYDLKKSAMDYSFYVDEYVALRLAKLAIDGLEVKLDEQPTTGNIVMELKDLMLHSPPNELQKISS